MPPDQEISSRKPLPSSARVVVVAGGIIGCSVAYQLTKRGWNDVVVLERDALGCGTTWHSHGLVGLMRASPVMTKLALRTNDVLNELEQVTDQATGFRQNGTVVFANERNNLEQLRRLASSMKSVGLDLHEISVDEAKRRWPLAKSDDALGGFFMPDEGQTNALDTLQAYAKAARAGGAQVFEKTKVTDFQFRNGRVCNVVTERGAIAADYVVNSTGMWSREVAAASGFRVPVMPVEQCYVVTEAIPEIAPDAPIFRNYSVGVSARVDSGQLTIGASTPRQKPWAVTGIPAGFSFDELPDDWDQFEPMIEKMVDRIPVLEEVGIRKFLTGPEAMSPDARYFLGPVPGCDNYFVIASLSGVGVGSSGGIGEQIATWIVDGAPSMDLTEVDIKRAAPFETNLRYLQERVGEGGGALFDIFWPLYQPQTARNIRQTVLHDRLKNAHAQFSVRAGWEDADWFAGQAEPDFSYRSFDRGPWFEAQKKEHLAPWTTGGFSDLSNHAKVLVQGPQAAKKLAGLCVATLPVGQRKQVFSPLVDTRGCVAFCADICRISDDAYLLLADPTLQSQLTDWLKTRIGGGTGCVITDMTSAYAILSLVGTGANAHIADITNGAVQGADFEPGQFIETELGYGHGRLACRGSSELPVWDMVIPTEFAAGLYDILMSSIRENLQPIGTRARRGLMLEAGLHHREQIYPRNKAPSDLGFAAHASDLHDTSFASDGQLLVLKLSNPEHMLFGNEIILLKDKIVGRVFAQQYGYRVEAPVALCLIEKRDCDLSTALIQGWLTVEIAGERALLRPVNEDRLALSA